MQRFDFFFRQKVTEGELDAAFDAVEQMEFNSHLAQGLVGAQSQAIVTENSGTPNLTVDISGPAEIRDQLGQRVAWTASQDVDCSVDENSNSTAVGAAPNERYLSIFAKFARTLSDPRLDGTGAAINFNRAEGFQINVVQGAEAALGTASRPATRADEILLADVLLVFGQTQILNANISTTRRQSAFVTVLGSTTIRAGQAEDALQQVASAIEAAAGGGGPYVQVSDLADATTPDAGTTLVGVDALAGTPTSTAQGTVQTLAVELLAAINARVRSTIPIGTSLTVPLILDERDNNPDPALLFEGPAGVVGGEKVRIYFGQASPRRGVWFTTNAAWNPSTNVWTADVAGESKAIVFLDSVNEIQMYRRAAADNPAGGETWDNNLGAGGWQGASGDGQVNGLTVALLTNQTQLALGVNDEGLLSCGEQDPQPGAGQVQQRALYSKNMPKAWGSLTTTGGGAVTIQDGFRINTTTTIVGSNISVRLSPSFPDADYCVVAMAASGEYLHWAVDTKLADRFELKATSILTDGAVNLSSAIANVDFVLFSKDTIST